MHVRLVSKIIIFFVIFEQSFFAASQESVSNALDLAHTIFLATGAPQKSGVANQSQAKTLSISIQQNVSTQVFAVGPSNSNTSQLWLTVTINQTQYLLAAALESGYANSSLPSLSNVFKALNALTVVDWLNGVYVSTVQQNNQVFVIAQKYDPATQQMEYIAGDAVVGQTSITGNVTWAGSYFNPNSLVPSTTLGLTTATTPLFSAITVSTSSYALANAKASSSVISSSVTLESISTKLGGTNSPASVSFAATANSSAVGGLKFSFDGGQAQYFISVDSAYESAFSENIAGDISSVISNLNSSYTILLVGVDTAGNVMPTLVNPATEFSYFALYLFDATGSMIGKNPVAITELPGSSITATSPTGLPNNGCVFSTRDLSNNMINEYSVTYPFTIEVNSLSQSSAINLNLMKTSLGVPSNSSQVTMSLSQKSDKGLPLAAMFFNFGTGQSYYAVALAAGETAVLQGTKLTVHADISSLIASMTPGYTMMLVALDVTQKMMLTLSSTFDHFVLYIFDQNGNAVANTPVTLARDTTLPATLSSGPFFTADSSNNFITNVTVTYPFIINIVA